MADSKKPTAEDQVGEARRALAEAKVSLELNIAYLPSDDGREDEKVKGARSVLQQALSHVNAELHTYEP